MREINQFLFNNNLNKGEQQNSLNEMVYFSILSLTKKMIMGEIERNDAQILFEELLINSNEYDINEYDINEFNSEQNEGKEFVELANLVMESSNCSFTIAQCYCFRLFINIVCNNSDALLKRVTRRLYDIINMLDLDCVDDIPFCIEGVREYFELTDVSDNISSEKKEVIIDRIMYVIESNLSKGNLKEKVGYQVPKCIQESELNTPSCEMLKKMGYWTLNHKREWKDIQAIQEYSIMILKAIDEVCKEIGVQYFLCEGALLGAVRDHAPISWDDDIDIGMMREDYEEFILKAAGLLFPQFVIDSFETNKKHWTISAKVQLAKTTEYYREKSEGIALYNGPFVDIFAFDRSPKAKGKWLVIRGRIISGLRAVLLCKTGFQKTPPKRKPRLKLVLSKILPISFIRKLIDMMCKMYSKGDYRFVTNFGSLYKAVKETFQISDIFPLKVEQYAGMNVPVPNCSEKMLMSIYGDYQVKPPYWKREGKHGFNSR